MFVFIGVSNNNLLLIFSFTLMDTWLESPVIDNFGGTTFWGFCFDAHSHYLENFENTNIKNLGEKIFCQFLFFVQICGLFKRTTPIVFIFEVKTFSRM